MTIIFDLDYTLLDTVKFKDALREAVTSLGVSAERYEETYKQIVKREGRAYDYDPDAHLEALRADFGKPEAIVEARARIDGVLARTEEFLYPGSVEMVRKYRDAGARVVLLTMGNEQWQEAKAKHSGLAELFDRVVTVGKGKSEALRGFALEDSEVIIVNDNGSEMKEMMGEVDKWRLASAEKGSAEKIPKMKFIMKRGPKPVPTGLALEPKELNEVERIIDGEFPPGAFKPRESREGRLGRR